VFYVFDLLWLDGQDLRAQPLIERKRMLCSIIPEQPSVLLYASHIERNGVEFFRLSCEQDLEGIVAKLKRGRYGEGWFKIWNPSYSQREVREEGSLYSQSLRSGGVVALGDVPVPEGSEPIA
jgi:bifunctional non-homologous end joining protein LigD